MVNEDYVALYRIGSCNPLGVVRNSIVDSLLSDLEAHTNQHYWTKPITSEQAKQVKEEITRGSVEVENLFARKA
ncbi:MAG: hypothetical protein Q8P15_01135 [Nanoarchaeota archaeon]|nr:hypothetical protein [Nanoarchaeota archaeon]